MFNKYLKYTLAGGYETFEKYLNDLDITYHKKSQYTKPYWGYTYYIPKPFGKQGRELKKMLNEWMDEYGFKHYI